ncbi:MAG: OsmC family protein [Solirubrobacterales bacterium]
MTMRASTSRVGNTLKHEVDVNGRHAIVTDEPLSLGGTDEGPAPHELLPAALASCISTTVAMYANRHEWEIGEVSVDVEYDNESSPRRLSIDVHLPPDLTDEQQLRLERVARTCPLRRALESGFSFEEHVLAESQGSPVD